MEMSGLWHYGTRVYPHIARTAPVSLTPSRLVQSGTLFDDEVKQGPSLLFFLSFFFDDCHTRAMLGPSHRQRDTLRRFSIEYSNIGQAKCGRSHTPNNSLYSA